MGLPWSKRHSSAFAIEAGVCRPLKEDIPLCVDLDGTLLRTDTLLESVIALLRRNPLYLLLFPIWFVKGRANLKAQVAQRVTLDVSRLPYNDELREVLVRERRRGRRLFLVTASNVEIAQQIAEHLDIFSGVFASDETTNLSGRKKRQLLEREFGLKGFDYAGNSPIDLTIWAGAHHAIVVNAPARLIRRAERVAPATAVGTRSLSLWTLAKALRVHQWAKNILVFVPLVTSHRVAELHAVMACLCAFFAFSFCASAGYLINDVLDLPHDRQHPRKRYRALASGQLSLVDALAIIPLCLTASLLLSVTLPMHFLWILVLYFSCSLAYSLYFKQFALVDVILLAGLYALRIYAGAVAIRVMPSEWLLLFSMFIFLSLALMKRFAELRGLSIASSEPAVGRAYYAADLEHIASIGTASGYIAVLVLALYVNSPGVAPLYRRPELLWLTCPLMLYWISRGWLLAYRGQMNEDPVVFALKDTRSYLIGGLVGVIMLLAA
jgi:4-hydroxybenzoate polyprenyltransferase